MVPAVLAAGETRYPVGAQRHRLIRAHCDDQWHATTNAGSLCCVRHSTFRQALRSGHAVDQVLLHGKSLPRHAQDAALVIPRGSLVRGPMLFFHSAMTVFGLICKTHAVSRMPLAFMAISTIC